MGLSRSGTLFLIGLLALIGLSLHPVAGVEAFVGALFAPARLLAELALPLRALSAKSVRASEAETQAAAEAERARSRALLIAAQEAAMPAEASLHRGRALVGAHVVQRMAKNRDRVILRHPADSGVAPGMPVVCGDVYVGRVVEIDARHPGTCLAELVTARGFRVGAVVDASDAEHESTPDFRASKAKATEPAEPARFVVGGVLGDARDRGTALHLSAQFPSDHEVKEGDLRVAEDDATDFARLADGFRLGRLEQVCPRGMDPRVDRLLPGVRPLVDYASGLSQLAIVCPPEMSTAGPVLAVDPFDAPSWIDARVLLAGDPSVLRVTRKLALRASSGVHAGAALSLGARFVGRVGCVGAWSADARLLADEGVSFHAMARVEGVDAPQALGLLVSLGADGDGVAFTWPATIPLDTSKPGPLQAEVWTAAGEPDVPPGLLVGTTTLPRGRGPLELHVKPAQDPHDALHFAVWRGREKVTEAP